MRRSTWTLLALSSALCAAAFAPAATRPHYGGTLRVKLRASVPSLDPVDADALSAGEAAARERIWELIADRLVRLDSSGRPQPMLAASWQRDAEGKEWQFRLRPGVLWQDGSRVDGPAVAAALQPLLKGVDISGTNLLVSFHSDRPVPDLLSILAEPRACVVRRGAASVEGTGPFRLTRWEPGRQATLLANENYWAGRPFLDEIEIDMGRPAREQIADFELDRADVVELSLADVRRAAQRGRKLWESPPVELLALRFVPGHARDSRLREAVALAIDRQPIYNVLLQRQGEVYAALLPQWVSGYAFSFPAAPDFARARQLALSVPAAMRTLTMSVDASDPLARAVADRIAVTERDADITLQPIARNGNAALQLVRLRLASPDPGPAFAALAAALGLTGTAGSGIDTQYAAERALLEAHHVIPLAHLPEVYGLGSRVRNWVTSNWEWRIADVWLQESGPEARP